MPKADKDLVAQSSINSTSIESSVFVAHGVDDFRCSVEEARDLKSVLERHKKDFKYKEYKNIATGSRNLETGWSTLRS